MSALFLHHDGLSRPLNDAKGVYLSLGAGVQSSWLAIASARGDLPPLDAALFADTGDEPAKVYAWLDWLQTQVPYPIHRIKRPGATLSGYTQQMVTGEVTTKCTPPLFTKDPQGFLNKQCSKEFKTRVITSYLRQQLGLRPGARGPGHGVFEVWIGISTDEIVRMKSAEQRFMHNRWPVIEARMSRRDCLTYFEERQLPKPPRSACWHCPFHSDDEWSDMKANDPEDWARAVAHDAMIRRGFKGMEGTAYLHHQRVPLDQVDFTKKADPKGLFGFANECEGMCGV